jgi:hypothetical protein
LEGLLPRIYSGLRWTLRNLGPWALTGGLLYWAFQRVPYSEVVEELARVSIPRYLALWLPWDLAIFFLNTLSIKWIMDWFIRPVSFREFWPVMAASYIFTLINPLLTFGAVLVWLNRRNAAPALDLGGGVLFIIAVDMFFYVIMVGLGLLYLRPQSLNPLLENAIMLLKIGVFAGIIFYTYFYFFWVRKYDFKWLGFQREVHIFQPFNIATMSHYSRYFLLRVGFWAIAFVRQYLLMIWIFDIHFPFGRFMTLMPLVNAISMLGVSGYGTTQMVWLELFGEEISEDTLMALTLSWDFLFTLTAAVGGIFGLIVLFRRLRKGKAIQG